MYREIPLPMSIAFEPINLCNAKCFCCPYTTLSEDISYHGKRMTREQIGKLLYNYGSLINCYAATSPEIINNDIIFDFTGTYFDGRCIHVNESSSPVIKNLLYFTIEI